MSQISDRISRRKEADRLQFQQAAGNLMEMVCQKKVPYEDGSRINDDMEAVDLVLERLTDLRPVTRGFDTIEEYIGYQTYSSGIMKRIVELPEGWYRKALGCMLGIRKENGTLAALLPDAFGQYSYFDSHLRKKIKITAKNADQFSNEAMLFYAALPPESLTVRDLVSFCFRIYGLKSYFVTAAFSLVCALLSGLIPFAVYRLFGDVISAGSPEMVRSVAVFLLGLVVILHTFRILHSVMLNGYITACGCMMEAAAFSRVLLLKPDFHTRYNAGELSNMVQAVKVFSENCISLILDVFPAALFSLVFLADIVFFSPGLLKPVLVILGISAGLYILLLRLNIRHVREKYKADQQENSLSYSLIQGMEKIHITGSEVRMYSLWSSAYARKNNTLYDPPLLLKIGTVLIGLIYQISILYIYGMTLETGTTPAGYLAFASAFALFTASTKKLVESLLSFTETIPMIENAAPILEAVPEARQERKFVTKLTGDIQLQDVEYHYEESTVSVFHDLSLHIRPGEHVSIIGRSGNGKSTLVDLLLGYASPQSGVILYDSDNLENLDLRSLRQHIGTVLQNDRLIPGTVRNNIKLSDPFLDDDKIWEALRIVGLSEYVSGLPLGLDSIILEGTEDMPGGIRQKLLLARAIATKPPVLILDEATATMDHLTRNDLKNALEQLKCTCISLSNNPSSALAGNRILLLDKGRILDSGTREELLQRCALFRSLAKSDV